MESVRFPDGNIKYVCGRKFQVSGHCKPSLYGSHVSYESSRPDAIDVVKSEISKWFDTLIRPYNDCTFKNPFNHDMNGRCYFYIASTCEGLIKEQFMTVTHFFIKDMTCSVRIELTKTSIL
jgi:hypothetical protein